MACKKNAGTSIVAISFQRQTDLTKCQPLCVGRNRWYTCLQQTCDPSLVEVGRFLGIAVKCIAWVKTWGSICSVGLCACIYVCIHSQVFTGSCCMPCAVAEAGDTEQRKIECQTWNFYCNDLYVHKLCSGEETRAAVAPWGSGCGTNTYIHIYVYVRVYIYGVLPYLRIFCPMSIFLRQDVVDRMRLAPIGLDVWIFNPQ